MKLIDLAVVTGAGRGIGKGVAKHFGEKGVHVLCISKSDNAVKTSFEIRSAGGSSEALVLDLCNATSAKFKIESWIQESPYRSISVNLAAGILGPQGSLADADLGSWEETFKANIFGNLAVVQALLPRMKESKFGRIVFFSGGGAAFPFPEFSAYAASKVAIVRIAENLHLELSECGDFCVVSLAPGTVKTDMLKNVEAAGVPIKNYVDVTEPAAFSWEFSTAEHNHLSGKFVHVSNDWKAFLTGDDPVKNSEYWKLRVEQNTVIRAKRN